MNDRMNQLPEPKKEPEFRSVCLTGALAMDKELYKVADDALEQFNVPMALVILVELNKNTMSVSADANKCGISDEEVVNLCNEINIAIHDFMHRRPENHENESTKPTE